MTRRRSNDEEDSKFGLYSGEGGTVCLERGGLP